MKTETIYQILVETNMSEKLVQWFDDKDKADAELKELEEMFPEETYRIEEGTDYIYVKCRGCETVHTDMKYDSYGIETGNWCDECYNSDKYPYRKDNYFDPAYAGESLYSESDI